MSQENERITWRWVAGISGAILFAAGTAWAMRVEAAASEVPVVKAYIGYIERDVKEIKELLKEALGKR